MPRLRRADPSQAGITRKRAGRGFRYVQPDGSRVTDDETLERIAALAIPPAWTDVWICTHDCGHLQALGTDGAGRRQYLYHEQWRTRRDRAKFERMMAFAQVLPALRERIARDLTGDDAVTRDRVLALAMRLLDRGFFRVGSEQYADANGTFGLATIRKAHVSVEPPTIVFDYRAKHGKRRVQCIVDEEAVDLVATLKRRRGGGDELLAWRDADGRWTDMKSGDVNDYIKQATGGEFSAKDFRTWHATVLAAMAIAILDTGEQQARQAKAARRRQHGGGPQVGAARAPAAQRRSPTATRRLVSQAVKEVAHYLGNTPAVCRSSYIDPRVFDRFQAGRTIAPALEQLHALDDFEQPAMQRVIEVAVLDLLSGKDEPVIERRAAKLIEQLAP